MNYRIGTRNSRLAMVQAEMLADAIRAAGNEAEIVSMTTSGDRILDKSLAQIGGKGLFMKELDEALFQGRTDLSLHCVKDMMPVVPDAYPVLGVSKREDPRDVLVLPKGQTEPVPGKPVGCSSIRRRLQFQKLYPGVAVKDVRGNVLTRLEKLDRGEYGALILAAAGLKRLGLEHRISRYFTPEEMLPAAGQGVLAVQGPKDLDTTGLEGFFDEDAYDAVRAERSYIRELNGGCTSPVCAYATIDGRKLTLRALYVKESETYDEETPYVIRSVEGDRSDAEAIGASLARSMLELLQERK